MSGVCVSKGVVIAKPYAFRQKSVKIDFASCDKSQSKKQMDIFDDALLKTKEQLEKLKEDAEKNIGKEESKIINVQLVMLQDPLFIDGIREKINEGRTAEAAVEMTRIEIEDSFKDMKDKIIKLREEDINDVSSSIIKNILGVSYQNLSNLKEQVILVAEELTPSDIVHMHKNVKGIILESYNESSHSTIMIKTIGIPTMAKVEGAVNKYEKSDMIILDTVNNEIISNPTKKDIHAFEEKKNNFEIDKKKLLKLKNEESKTMDGKKVSLYANIGTEIKIDDVTALGAEGIGLFRTEFIFIDRETFPSEEEQFEIYRSITERFHKEVIIRTFDISEDKCPTEYKLFDELNPALGNRGIRFCLNHKDIFKSQLRAILRASAYGEAKIMYPMISSIEEFNEANKILRECKKELKGEGILFDDNIKVGITIEVPSATMIIDILAKEADFFSIGTNDLAQYLLAVDRRNKELPNFYKDLHPALIRTIKLIIDGAHKENKLVGICGEIAGNVKYVPFLIGLGIDLLSMNPQNIFDVKKVIRNTKYDNAAKIARNILKCNSVEEVKSILKMT